MEVIGLYHAAHAPEVLWAMDHALAWQETYGAFSGYVASFADPYRERGRAHNQVYVNSWVDSGINALSAAYRFLQLTAIDQLAVLDEQDSTFRASVRFRSNGRENAGTIETSWAVPVPAKHTILRLGEATHLYLDHQLATGHLRHGDTVREEFAYTGTVPRLQMHYENNFRSIFIDKKGYYTASESRLLHRLLFARAPEQPHHPRPARMISRPRRTSHDISQPGQHGQFRPRHQAPVPRRKTRSRCGRLSISSTTPTLPLMRTPSPAALRSGKMPCDGAWPAAQVATFQHWMDAGKPA